MRKIKIFKSIESELISLETEINDWIVQSKATLVSVTGNIAPQTGDGGAPLGSFSASDVLVIVVYEESNG